MKKGNSPLVIIVIVFVIAIGAAVLYFARGSSTPSSDLPTPHAVMQDDSMGDMEMVERDDSMAEESEMPEAGAKYVQYSKAGYEQIKDQRHVLFFYANWCPICKPADAEFQAKMSQIPDDIILVRVNYNDTQTDADEQALADKYGITYQHTFVLLENGQVAKKWNGGGIDELLAQVR